MSWSHSYVAEHGDVILLHDRLPYAGAVVRALSGAAGANPFCGDYELVARDATHHPSSPGSYGG
ncbi:MAG: hypothetical protein R3B91_11410 [Planctomycetaceae bacterium]